MATQVSRPASASVSSMTTTDVRPSLHPLKTPSSATLPSELPTRSPYPRTPASARIKDEEGGFMKTPISPPTAYTDFLKAVSSPGGLGLRSAPTSAPSTSKSTISSSERSHSSSSVDTLQSRSSSSCSCPCAEHAVRPATSKSPPAPLTLPSPPSTTSGAASTTAATSQPPSHSSSQPLPPQSAPLTMPTAPQSAPLRRLRIPPSGSSPVQSPATATTMEPSPVSAAFSVRSPFTVRSPLELELEGSLNKRWSLNSDGNGNSNGSSRKPVSVRQVVTRTVTYTPRMDLAPAPKGKKRRLE